MIVAIISRRVNGQFAEVGTSNRTIIKRNQMATIRKYAKAYANGAAYRIEYFHEGRIYGEPWLVQTFLSEETMIRIMGE